MIKRHISILGIFTNSPSAPENNISHNKHNIHDAILAGNFGNLQSAKNSSINKNHKYGGKKKSKPFSFDFIMLCS